MLADKLLEYYREQISVLRNRELLKIDRAAKAAAERIAAGGRLFLFDRGHLLSQELFYRAGGLALIRPLEPDKELLSEWPMAAKALEESGLRAGDVLIAGSVSGKNAFVVQLALEARRMGVAVVALTSVAFSSQVVSDHPEGLRLFEAADHVLDIHAEPGDAVLTVPGLQAKMAPISGISAAVVGWCLKVQIAEHLLKLGIEPTVYLSVNLPGGPEQFDAANQRLQKLGY